MEEIKFTKDHYYVIVENDLATVGLTDFVLNKDFIIEHEIKYK